MTENRFFLFGTKGSPDIVAVFHGRYVGIEVKGSNGRQNPDQKAFEAELTKAGGVYVLATTIEDVEQVVADLSVQCEPKMAA